MIKLKDILNESTITSQQFKHIDDVIDVFYDTAITKEISKESRGEFLRITFRNYNEAINFYNTGADLLKKIVKLQRSNTGNTGPKRIGNLFMVSYKLIDN